MIKDQKIINLAKLFTKKPIFLIKELNLFYSKLTNGDKIFKLLIIWLYQYHFYLITYKKSKNFKKFLTQKKSILLSAEKLSFNKYDFSVPKKNFLFSFMSILVANCFKNWILRGYGYEKEKKFSRYLFFISRFFLRYLPFAIDIEKKKKLLKILSNYLSDTDLEYLNLSLPDIFFSKEIELLSKTKKIIKASPSAFFDFDGYEKILLVKNKIIIHGFQHGGGYELKKDLIRLSEQVMSDYYYSWGFGNLNIIQHRFKNSKKNSFHNKKRKILWIERGKLPKIYKFIYPQFFNELNDKKNINFIERELQNYKDEAFRVPYLDRLSKLYKNNKIKSLYIKKQPELFINFNDLIIFDHINHTLIYFCLCRNIRFLCVINLKKYSKNYDKNYIDFLKSKNAIIDCSSKLLKNNLKNGSR